MQSNQTYTSLSEINIKLHMQHQEIRMSLLLTDCAMFNSVQSLSDIIIIINKTEITFTLHPSHIGESLN